MIEMLSELEQSFDAASRSEFERHLASRIDKVPVLYLLNLLVRCLAVLITERDHSHEEGREEYDIIHQLTEV